MSMIGRINPEVLVVSRMEHILRQQCQPSSRLSKSGLSQRLCNIFELRDYRCLITAAVVPTVATVRHTINTN